MCVNHNRQKKLAVINDICGFGRCSLTAQLPIISAMGVQCCPLPTAVFSNHPGFPTFYRTDYTQHMGDYSRGWQQLGLEFSGIATGYLSCQQQIDLVKEFFDRFGGPQTCILVDPVMGDHGSLYGTYPPELARQMIQLVPYAHILTPNLTEACILTDTPYNPDMPEETLLAMCQQLSQLGPEKVVISGIEQKDTLGNFVFQRNRQPMMLRGKQLGPSRSGTGDVFSAILAADMVKGVDFFTSVQRAMDFISLAIRKTIRLEIPTTDGLAIEECLSFLLQNRF